jgi:hypothetical protein
MDELQWTHILPKKWDWYEFIDEDGDHFVGYLRYGYSHEDHHGYITWGWCPHDDPEGLTNSLEAKRKGFRFRGPIEMPKDVPCVMGICNDPSHPKFGDWVGYNGD